MKKFKNTSSAQSALLAHPVGEGVAEVEEAEGNKDEGDDDPGQGQDGFNSVHLFHFAQYSLQIFRFSDNFDICFVKGFFIHNSSLMDYINSRLVFCNYA